MPHFDLVVVGGGSGGLATAKRAAKNYGKKVALLDFVKPSPAGTVWGVGGTCVNVGCIPKKLMHQAALVGEEINNAHTYGWEFGTDEPVSEWADLRRAVDMHIKALNGGYMMEFSNIGITYINGYARFTPDPHKLLCTTKRGFVKDVTGDHVVIATGTRPTNINFIPGGEHAISSDDVFRRRTPPGDTLVVGGGYIAVETAGMLRGLGNKVTLMVRSIVLRTMDRDMGDRVAQVLRDIGVKVVLGTLPSSIKKLESGKFSVTWEAGGEVVKEYDTVLAAIGRSPRLSDMGLDEAGIHIHNRSGKVLIDDHDTTSSQGIYAIGDVAHGIPELTPVASRQGQLLVDRLFGQSSRLLSLKNLPTTVFAPVEYGFVGLNEQEAIEQYGLDNIEVFHGELKPLEWELPDRPGDVCYTKLIVELATDRIIGFHYLAPNAGEVAQLCAVAMTAGATKEHFNQTIGIHPTVSEALVQLASTKRSGKSFCYYGHCWG